MTIESENDMSASQIAPAQPARGGANYFVHDDKLPMQTDDKQMINTHTYYNSIRSDTQCTHIVDHANKVQKKNYQPNAGKLSFL